LRLFEPIWLRGVRVPNRIVKSAMAEGRAELSGRPTPALVRSYARWARGGVGLAITGMAHVREGFSFTDHEIGLYDDALIEPLTSVTRAVHEQGGRIVAQLCHAPPQLPRAKARRLGAVAPSCGLSRTNLLVHHAIDSDELWRLVAEFGAAARRAREAGFDGAQLHAAHGYLLSRMLSPRFNRRNDRWGGSFERRLAFMREVVGAVRKSLGDELPLLVKLNVADGVRGGLVLEQGIAIARRLQAWGVDAIEVSAGVGDVGLGCYPNRGEIPVELGKEFLRREFPFLGRATRLLGPYLRAQARALAFDEGYFAELAQSVANAVDIPVIAVGGIRSRDFAERLLGESRVAMVSLARPLVRQPTLPRQWREGRSLVAQCTSCNECFVRIGLGEPLRCWKSAVSPAAT
jgi:2,4-dienoyl-CoA reductase-like NADH-dependent reductase (Old Yellow Enzyme family)